VRIFAETSAYSSHSAAAAGHRSTTETTLPPQPHHGVFLFPPLSQSSSSSSSSSSSTGPHSSVTTAVIRLVENRSARVQCSVIGGYPPPRLELTVVAVAARGGTSGSRDVTSHGTLSSTATASIRLGGSKPGFRRLLVVSERTTVDFVPTAGDDGGRLNCQATVHGLRQRFGSIGLEVDCEYFMRVFRYREASIVGISSCSSIGIFVSRSVTSRFGRLLKNQ
jgi:hypothetical protein